MFRWVLNVIHRNYWTRWVFRFHSVSCVHFVAPFCLLLCSFLAQYLPWMPLYCQCNDCSLAGWLCFSYLLAFNVRLWILQCAFFLFYLIVYKWESCSRKETSTIQMTLFSPLFSFSICCLSLFFSFDSIEFDYVACTALKCTHLCAKIH